MTSTVAAFPISTVWKGKSATRALSRLALTAATSSSETSALSWRLEAHAMSPRASVSFELSVLDEKVPGAMKRRSRRDSERR